MSTKKETADFGGDAQGLTREQCQQAEAYLRRGYFFLDDLAQRLGVSRIHRDPAFALQMAPILYEMATFVKGTMGQTILFLQTQGQKGLNPQVPHPVVKGQVTRAGMRESEKGDETYE